MSREISNSDDVIDSRDVIARIEELVAEIEDIEGDDFDAGKVGGPDDPVDADMRDELTQLRQLADETENYASDWKYGATLIRETYFVEYCQELCDDIGDMPKGLPSYIVVDWEATADNLRIDYTEVDYDGVAYLIR